MLWNRQIYRFSGDEKGAICMSKKAVRVVSVILAVIRVFGLAATMIGGFLGG